MVQYGDDIYFSKFETETKFIFCKAPVINIDNNETSMTISGNKKKLNNSTPEIDR